MDGLYTFVGGPEGSWRVRVITALRGAELGSVPRLGYVRGQAQGGHDGSDWRLRGVVSNLRYTLRREAEDLRSRQAEIGRAEARHAALIPIRKSAGWWSLAQDERRAIFEETSHHTAIGMEYLPAVARRLHHSRDLGEPFDFLTWFEYAPADEPKFDAMLARLRATPEWDFVEREVDIRVTLDVADATR